MTRTSAAEPFRIDTATDESARAPAVTATILRFPRLSSRLRTIAARRRRTRPPRQEADAVDARIRAFLDGETNGESLLHEMYDSVLDEPIPESMRALLER